MAPVIWIHVFISSTFTIGLEVSSIVDISVENAKKIAEVGWTEEQIESVLFFDNLKKMISQTKIDVLVEATGDPVEEQNMHLLR